MLEGEEVALPSLPTSMSYTYTQSSFAPHLEVAGMMVIATCSTGNTSVTIRAIREAGVD